MEGDGVVVCIPAHDEEKTIAKVVVGAKKSAGHVIVCDDGSVDMTAEIASSLGAQVIRHTSNEGKGKALASLVNAAIALSPRVIVTIDGDDQHDPRDIPAVVQPVLLGKADVVVGVRPMDSPTVPRDRAFGNKVLDHLASSQAGVELHDTQSGFRAYSLEAARKISFSQDGMAIESQTLLDAVKVGLRIAEVPVSVRYDGQPKKRSRVVHLSDVANYLVSRTIVESPLLYLGLPGLAAMVIGIVAGVRVLNIFINTHQIAIGTGLIAAILLIVGIVVIATSLILKLMTVRFRESGFR